MKKSYFYFIGVAIIAALIYVGGCNSSSNAKLEIKPDTSGVSIDTLSADTINVDSIK